MWDLLMDMAQESAEQQVLGMILEPSVQQGLVTDPILDSVPSAESKADSPGSLDVLHSLEHQFHNAIENG